MIFQNFNNNQQAAITNAQAYFQMDMANLSNRQQTNLQNINVRQNNFYYQIKLLKMLHFNLMHLVKIKLINFMINLTAQINEQNAARIDAMNKFAEAESNKFHALNAQNTIAVEMKQMQKELL